jgi:hypothetical protein
MLLKYWILRQALDPLFLNYGAGSAWCYLQDTSMPSGFNGKEHTLHGLELG